MNKLLTVLICNHNHGQFIARCLNSLSLQTLDKSLWSILWINNACSDGSEEILNRLIKDDEFSENKLPEIRVLTVPEKRGLAYVKNIGLKEINTKYWAVQDCDDQSLSDRLKMQLDVLESDFIIDEMTGKPYRVDVCACQAFDLYPNGQIRINCFSQGQYKFDSQIKDRLPSENILCHTSIMARKSAMDLIGGYPEGKEFLGKEDYVSWLRMANAGLNFFNISERLILYSLGSSVGR